jgi:hypothetical protein
VAPPKGKRSHIKLGRWFRDAIAIREVIIDDDGATVIEPLQTAASVTAPHTELLQRMSAITAQVTYLSEQLHKQQQEQQQQQQQQQRRSSSSGSSSTLQHASSFVVPIVDAAATAETKTSGGAAIGLLRSAYAHTAEQPLPVKRLSSQLKTASTGSSGSSSNSTSAVLSSSSGGFLRRRNRNGSTTAAATTATDTSASRLSASTSSIFAQRATTSTGNITISNSSSNSSSSRSLSGLGGSNRSNSGSMRLKAEDVNEWRQRAAALLKKQESRRAAVRLQAAVRGYQQVQHYISEVCS